MLFRSKDKFFSIIAHDLKGPFSSLLGFSDILLDEFESLSKEEMYNYMNIIRNTARSSLFLLDNLLAWSRLQTGRMPFSPGRISLSREVDSLSGILASQSFRKKITIRNSIDKELFVYADRTMLICILNNLLMNAVKFTPAGGQVTVSAIPAGPVPVSREDSRLVTIAVTDTGVGMSPEEIAQLFSLTKPFTMPGTDRETGTGLGLILTREMIEKHGSSLHIESEPGKGSSFSFRVPLFTAES